MTQSRTPINFPRISRTIDDIRTSLYARIDAVQTALAQAGYLPRRLNLNKGVFRGLIELFAWGQWQIYTLLQNLLQQALPHYSSGRWLDLHAQSVGLERKRETKARGLVRFMRDLNTSGNIVISAGRIVRTLPDGNGEVFRYVTTEAAVLVAEEEFVAVPVEAEEYGASANAAAGQICELVTPVTGVADVSNTADWLTSEGADAETDAQLIERIRVHWMSNNGCTKYAYEAWALSVPGTVSVSILDRHPRGQGTVGVVVRGSATIPTEALLESVRDVVAPKAPINDDWFVVAPEASPVSVAGCLHYVKADTEQLKELATQRILSLFSPESAFDDVAPLGIGQDVPLDLLTSVIMGVPGVKFVTWSSPSENVIVPQNGIALLESLSFSTQREEEI